MAKDMIPVLIAALLPLVALLGIRLRVAAQPLRLELAQLGEEFLADENASPALRRYVGAMLNSAFGMRWALLMSIVTAPFILFGLILHRQAFLAILKEFDAPPEIRGRFDRILRLHDRITLANHPVLLPLFEFVMLVFLPLVILGLAVFRGRLPARISRDVLATYLENPEARGRAGQPA